MNILWLINIPLPEASELMNENPTPFGGWLVNASAALSEQSDINLSITFPKKGIREIQTLEGNKIKFYTFSPVSDKIVSSGFLNVQFEEILKKSKPDIVHIFGTEYSHTLAMVNTCNKENIKTVISIQGLVSICSRHYMASVPERVQRRFAFRDFIKQDNLKQQQKKFDNRGKFEIEAIQKVKHVIGRTTWDKACTTQINPNVKYHFCNETLRDEFYKHEWSLGKCERNSIFMSQGSYPIKGLHYMLEALPKIIIKCPKTHLYIAGENITKSNSIKEKIRLSSYGSYIKELIQKYHLKNYVSFTGNLQEKEMCEQYLKSHVFVSASSIENSSNSIGEAMILGVPVVSSDVGGVKNLLTHNEEGFLYQHNAPYMLAHYICEIFADVELALKFSEKARAHAAKTNDREENVRQIVKIYKDIMEG